MTRHRLALFAAILFALSFLLICGMTTWTRPDGSTCYSTIQRGCLDAILEVQP